MKSIKGNNCNVGLYLKALAIPALVAVVFFTFFKSMEQSSTSNDSMTKIWKSLIKVSEQIPVPASSSSKNLIQESGICRKGDFRLDRDHLINELANFVKVYDKRPDENIRGSGFHHQFALWCLLRLLKPKHVIESGVHQGYGTWMIRQAVPKAQLTLLDPVSNRLKYRDQRNDTIYFIGKEFQDFNNINWVKLSVDPKNAVVFFDDHIHEVERVIQARKAGFRYMIFDDNFGTDRNQNHGSDADNFSMRLACAVASNKIKKDSTVGRVKMNSTFIKLGNHVFHDLIDVYYEFPSIWRLQNGEFNSIYPFRDITKVPFVKNMSRKPSKHSQMYFHICFVKLF